MRSRTGGFAAGRFCGGPGDNSNVACTAFAVCRGRSCIEDDSKGKKVGIAVDLFPEKSGPKLSDKIHQRSDENYRADNHNQTGADNRQLRNDPVVIIPVD